MIVGYLATNSFVSEHQGFQRLPSSMWLEHARLLADQALSIFTTMLAPVTKDRNAVLAGLAVLALASVFVWVRSPREDPVRSELRRWSYALLVCSVAIVGVYATYVPAMLYHRAPRPRSCHPYQHPHRGCPGRRRVRCPDARPRGVDESPSAAATGGSRRMAVVVPFAWFVVVAVDGARDVRGDAHVWAVAASHDYHELHVITSTLPHPVANSTVYAFGEAGTAAPGLPVFFSFVPVDERDQDRL